MHRNIGRYVASALVIAALGVLGGWAVALAQESTTQNGVTRTILAQAVAQNAPGQHLYLQEVRIAAGVKLGTHFHQGTQVASIRSGVLTYDIVSGTAAVTRASGKTEEVTGPAVIRLRRGDAITETASLVHFGSNKTKKPVVVLLAALLAEGAPLATPTAAGG
jgi:hypothetical protein